MELEERATDPLAGGMMLGHQCGMVWGATLAAGAQAYRLFGTGPQAEAQAMIAAQRIVESFRAQNQSTECREITGIDMGSVTARMILRFLVRTAPTGSCFGMAARYAHTAFDEIDTAFSDKHIEAPLPPISCSALLAQKIGVSDMHTIMAAGLAGGIGLSGGACGALGAAIWLAGINVLEKGARFSFSAPHAAELIARFTECTDNKFECSNIVGQRFQDVGDHARYLREGGCAQIIDTLAACQERR